MHNFQYSIRNYNVEDKEVFDQFVKELHNRFPYHDTFVTSDPIDIKQHTHSDFESRIFLSGFATFVIEGREIECGPGSYIEIQPNVKHSFKYSGREELRVLRFFSDEQSWHANYC